MRPLLLGVNIDHIATLRQCRRGRYPDPVYGALLAEQSGADSITLHLREDRRHIQDRDVQLLHNMKHVPMNLEMAMTDEMLTIAESIRPEYCCLVPERRAELTTEGGLDVAGQLKRAGESCRRLAAAGVRVSLFIDAAPEQIHAAHAAGAGVIEIHTGHYASATQESDRQRELQRIVEGANLARQLGMQVNAGHGLDYHNVLPIAAIPEISELNIGYSIIGRALFTGLAHAVREMKQLLRESRS